MGIIYHGDCCDCRRAARLREEDGPCSSCELARLQRMVDRSTEDDGVKVAAVDYDVLVVAGIAILILAAIVLAAACIITEKK